MRFYPFGSSSLNQIYNPLAAVTASISTYAASASYGIRVLSASLATNGVPGVNGTNGTCSFTPGLTGDIGFQGFGGPAGGVSTAVGKP